ncbi:hypothetical protein KD991_04795 [Treponema pallidum]|uniref:Uncharacterized protein TP_0966 n=1 Tax=Treponema pallidum (strain Nichols) TaxID=243276 RepID=Y966_TREPA|nr:hypothetical protein [Treponema pallidum]O83932.1 RecName: Full=Uncharacterized protein TP_0966; Flags: Precursor [Treponema pallidum subsp. pallidum str. Nichols]AAC65924.1 predicted coding region TP0966 [Treponema pallidum subsp. pallidum str. Nichols]ADD73056.1 conserved hypothetical protein [Treponema pallidum subsp. pallidum str. Chicago]AEZ61300.1 hypothetical protein TPADAL_0966 [Treponema pallidum subsp. pallidum DAL-1]AGN76131.1 hypothetical protein TPANIC_0966 [Treponema pallidum 
MIARRMLCARPWGPSCVVCALCGALAALVPAVGAQEQAVPAPGTPAPPAHTASEAVPPAPEPRAEGEQPSPLVPTALPVPGGAVAARAAPGTVGPRLWEQLLQWRVQHGDEHQAPQMAYEIAANNYDIALVKSIVDLRMGTGHIHHNLNGNGAGGMANGTPTLSPYVHLFFPTYQNLSLKADIAIKTNTPSADVTALFGMDLYSKVRRQHQLQVRRARNSMLDAFAAHLRGQHAAREAFLAELDELLSAYSTLLEAQVTEQECTRLVRTMRIQRYQAHSVKLRSATLKHARAERVARRARKTFTALYQDFVRKCGAFEGNDPETFMLHLAQVVPQEPVSSTALLSVENDWEFLKNREDLETQAEARAVDAISYGFNVESGVGSEGKSLKRILANVRMDFPGGGFWLGLNLPYPQWSRVEVKFRLTWDPLSIKYQELSRQTLQLHERLSALKLQDAYEASERKVLGLRHTAESLGWEQEAALTELNILRRSAQTHQKWLERGAIGAHQHARAQHAYLQALITLAKINIKILKFNLETASSFRPVL